MGARLKTFGFVLGKKPYKEKSSAFSIFTKELGLITAAAYGASYFGSSRSSHLDIGNLCDIELSKKHHYIIEAVNARQTWPNSRKQFEKSYLLLHGLSFLASQLPKESPHENIFMFLAEFLEENEKASMKNPLFPYVFFQWNILRLLGMIPKSPLFKPFESMTLSQVFLEEKVSAAKQALEFLGQFRFT